MISKEKKALIHVGKTALRLDDDEYRLLLQAEAGVESSRDLDDAGFDKVMKRFQKLGFVSTAREKSATQHRAKKAQGVARMRTPALIEKIRENYDLLGFDTIERRHGFNRRQCGKDEPRTVGDCIKVIEGQKAILRRRDEAGRGAEFSTSTTGAPGDSDVR